MIVVSRRAWKCAIQRRFYAGLPRSSFDQNIVNQARRFSPAFTRNAPLQDEAKFRNKELQRFFSTPAKNSTPEEAGQSKPEAVDKTPAAESPKVHASPPSSKPSPTQQSAQKPQVKPAQPQVAGSKPAAAAAATKSQPTAPGTVQAKTQVSQAAGGQVKPPSTQPGGPVKPQSTQAAAAAKTQVSPGAAPAAGQKIQPKSQAAAQSGAKSAPPATKVVPPIGQKPPTPTPTQNPSQHTIYLASGAVAISVLGLLYWQFPRIHDGATDAGGRGKDSSDTRLVADEKNPKESSEVAEESAPETRVLPDSDRGQENQEQAAVSVIVEPDGVKVIASEIASEPVESSDVDRSDEAGEKMNIVEEQVDSDEIVVEIKPESDEEVSVTVSAPEAEEMEISGDNAVVSVKEESGDISETFLIQRGHEDYVKHEKDNLVADAGSDSSKQSGLDVVAAIHAAEQKQAEIDAMVFKEQLQLIQEKYQHELTDVERKASSYQEQIRHLQAGLEKEKQTHSIRLKQQQEEAEARIREQIRLKDEEARRQLEEAELRAKAESAVALIEERASFLNDIGSVKVHMEAINAALEAKSEEAREGHEIKQLSVGTFALQDALLNGAPIHKEVDSILKSVRGDPLVEIAVVTLPREVLETGTLTLSELDQKLQEIEGTLRELAMIPPSGGGVLVHLLARIASSLKVPDHAPHQDHGVDAVMSRVQSFLKSGNLLDAAEVLSVGLSETNAHKLAGEWATQARNRAIAEQACALLRAHAAAIALSDQQLGQEQEHQQEQVGEQTS